MKKFLKNKAKYSNLIIGSSMILLLLFVALFANFIAPYRYDDSMMNERLQEPSMQHLLGTDFYGRDVFSRILYGARIALQIAAQSVGIQLVIGVTIGLLCGYFGGWIDRILSFIMDITWSMPPLIIAFAVVSVLGQSLNNAIIAIAVVSWAQYGRIVRAKTMSIKNMAFLETGIAFGESTPALLFRYILPNVVPSMIVIASISIPSAIMSTTALSFLGLGAQSPSPDWGLALSDSVRQLTMAPWLGIAPGLALVYTTLGFSMLGEGLRDLIDPRLRSL
ncbi:MULTISPECIES: ABC transporter permease [Brevibacillus]|uniref:ABC transporter permease n=1 Tax=Brevibacillus TaxID=55080 RepID=UPI0024560375|nr:MULTISPECIES: ABC transporter permease [Brevibacillus]MDF2680114.1 transporter permease [Brevibacillus sp.]MDH4619843.1 ABC transporter permease [Brevibacillus sp. AY1]MED4781212.1 ABC transporter permease [Brevibacillus choshinensis]